MKSIHLAILLFSFQFSKLVVPTAAKDILPPTPSWLENLLYPRTENSSSKPTDFVCKTTPRSPFSNHVLFGTDEMKTEQGHHWCTQENRQGSMCTQLIDYGTASIIMCGEYRTKLRCNAIADAIDKLGKICGKNLDGQSRVAGRAIFKWGYVEISDKRVSD